MASPTSIVLGDIADMGELLGVRRALAVEMERLGMDPACVDDAMVMVNELAANAVEHAGTRALVTLDWTATEVRVSVRDQSDQLPVEQRADPSRPGGRGLMIVAAFADRHGIDADPAGGKTVWFALDR